MARQSRMRSGLLVAAIATTMVLTMAAPAPAMHRDITRGDVVTLEGGTDLGYDLEGRVHMIRQAAQDGIWTYVEVRVWGLDPNTTYPVHVHNAPCSDDPPGGGHYQHEVGGPVDPVNEIWPEITSNPNGAGSGRAMHDNYARPDAQSLVIHYPEDTSIRLACADLS